MKPFRPLHLEIQTHRLNPVGILRSSFRQAGKAMHSNHGRLSGLNLEQLKLIQAAFAGQALPKGHPDALQILQSREYGASRAVLQLAKEPRRSVVTFGAVMCGQNSADHIFVDVDAKGLGQVLRNLRAAKPGIAALEFTEGSD